MRCSPLGPFLPSNQLRAARSFACATLAIRLTCYELAVAIRLKHRRGATLIEAARSGEAPARLDKSLIRAVCLTRTWAARLASGETASIRDLAAQHGLCSHYTSRLMPLPWLAPDLVTMVLEGRQPQSMSLSTLTSQELPLDWEKQRQPFSA